MSEKKSYSQINFLGQKSPWTVVFVPGDVLALKMVQNLLQKVLDSATSRDQRADGETSPSIWDSDTMECPKNIS